jgi:hypothetical protein
VVGKVVSGGQSGVDRAAIDAAIELGIPYGGWCPKGGLAEDLPEPPGLLDSYPDLKESGSPDPVVRTELNVRDSDGTLVLVPDGTVRSRGSRLTVEFASGMGRPFAIIDPLGPRPTDEIRGFLARLPDRAVLNVAGPRESQSPGAYEASFGVLRQALRRR